MPTDVVEMAMAKMTGKVGESVAGRMMIDRFDGGGASR